MLKKKKKEKTPPNLTVLKPGLVVYCTLIASEKVATMPLGDPSSAGSPKRSSSVTQSKYFHFILRQEGEVCGGISSFSEEAVIGLLLLLSIY